TNDADIGTLRDRMLLRLCNGTQLVTEVTFLHSSLTTQHLYTYSITSETVNDHPGSDLQSVLTQDGSQVITGYLGINIVNIRENLLTTETVGGVRVAQYCQRWRPCVVYAQKTYLSSVLVLGHLTVQDNRKVQGVDVSVSLSTWFSRTSCGHIPGITIFRSTIFTTFVTVYGSVDSIQVASGYLLTLSDNQTLPGSLSVTTNQGVWCREFRQGSTNTLNHRIYFKNAVNFLDANYRPGDMFSLSTRFLSLPALMKPFWHSFTQLGSLGLQSKWGVEGSRQVNEYWGWRSIQRFEGPPERIIPLRMDWGKTGTGDGTLALSSNYLALVKNLGDTLIL
ncbi:hypothetical protein Hamer_G012943, partial [Homarus americanus]